MFGPTAGAPEIDRDFVTCDIENRRNGSLISIDTFDGFEHEKHTCWGRWLDWLFDTAQTDKRYRRVYAHNGAGWDWLSLLEFGIRNRNRLTFQTVQADEKLIAVIVSDSRVRIELLDSVKLLQCSLDVAGKKFVGRGKVDTGGVLPEVLYRRNRTLYNRYHEGDTELLYEVLVRFTGIIHTIAPIKKLGITLPSTALRAFRTGYLDRNITTPDDPHVISLLREGYRGGRVEVFRPGHHKGINVYDFNSLYPAVMATTPVPVSGTVQRADRLIADTPGVYRVRFQTGSGKARRKPPLLMVAGRGVYRGEGVYFANELRRFSGKLEVLEGYTFPSAGILFRSYVENLYRLRMTDRTGPLGDVCKLLMNSLYGKFGQKPQRTETLQLDADQVAERIASGCGVFELSREYCIYRITMASPLKFEHVGIAGTITSEARGRLWDAMDLNTVYVDTDSVHTPNTMAVGSGLGMLKKEFTGEGVYCGKKLYALRNADTEKLRVKGVRIGGSNGCRLGFSDLLKVAKGATIACKFQSASTSNSVLSGGKPCRFTPRTRRIRNTVCPTL